MKKAANRAWKIVLLFLILAVVTVPVQAATIGWTQWTSKIFGNPGSAEGVINLPGGAGNVNVTYTGELFNASDQGNWDQYPGTYTAPGVVDNQPSPALISVQLIGGNSTLNKITFSKPLVDPVLAIQSLGNTNRGDPATYVFNESFKILAQGPGHWGGGNTSLSQSGNILTGAEGNGILQFSGTYSSISWTVPDGENWHMFTVGSAYKADGDLLYTSVKPCRIVDTRKTSAGIISASTKRNFRVHGSAALISGQGGNAGGCPAPMGEPLAAHINMVAVNATGKGNLQAFPVGAGTGAGLSVNYNTIDTNLANAGTVKTVTGVGPDITVASNFSSAHTVIDVLGYFYPNEGFYYTPVNPCRIVDTRKTLAGIIDANSQRDFKVYGQVSDQGGNPAGCPSTLGEPPEAAHLNVIAVDPISKGNLQAFPADVEPGAGLSVNYNTIDTNLANAGTVMAVTDTGPDITVASNFSSAHTVIDVLGYYSEEEDLLYRPVKPCRIVDTRKTPAGIIDANSQRDFKVYGTVGDQGGNPDGCYSLSGAPLAAHINMIAVNPTGKGNLQAFPEGTGTGAGLSVNYNTIDTNLANAGTVKTNPGITVASNFSSAHTVIDVLGYYYPAP